MRWNIYYGSREYAREQGDPLLGVVEAETKSDAERIALDLGLGGGAGVWALAEFKPIPRVDGCGVPICTTDCPHTGDACSEAGQLCYPATRVMCDHLRALAAALGLPADAPHEKVLEAARKGREAVEHLSAVLDAGRAWLDDDWLPAPMPRNLMHPTAARLEDALRAAMKEDER